MQTPLAVDPIATPHPVPLLMRPMCPSGVGHAQGEGRMKLCSRCQRDRFPEGGVQMTPVKWICQSCWIKFAQPKK
jgi:hypothetical protein